MPRRGAHALHAHRAEREQTARHVEPHRLVALGRRWYLVAFDLRRQDWRTFGLDRIEQPRSTEIRFQPRELPAEDAVAFVRAGWGNMIAAPHRIEMVVHATPSTVRCAAWSANGRP